MDVLDLSLPTVSVSSEDVEFIRVELSEYLVDSALGFYRGQHEDNETATFTFSVVEYETARDALLNAIRGFSVAPVVTSGSPRWNWRILYSTFRWWVSINAFMHHRLRALKDLRNALYYVDWP
jgi:hypothetical protein